MEAPQLQLLVETVQQLSLARSLNEVMDVVRKSARNLSGADGVSFILRENDLCYYADEDAISPLWKGQRFLIHNCVSGWAMLNKQAAIIEDIYVDDRVPIEAYKPTFVKSLVLVPIRTMDPIGALGHYWAVKHLPTEEEVKLLQSLADLVSVSIENVYVYKELEQRVKDRTTELEQANSYLQTFTHSVSHDLRSPLRTISGYLSILAEDYQDSKLDAKGHQMMQTVINTAGHMDELIEALLNFSKLGIKAMVMAPLTMKKMVENICADLRLQEKEREINFEIENLPDATGDHILMTQVWLNLLSNAVKYTANADRAVIKIGGGSVDCVTTYFVKDNGAGFEMEFYPKLFGIFQRLHDSEEFTGNGIGLSLAKQIITRHGGNIWAEAIPGEGAQFYFSLPNKATAFIPTPPARATDI